jgi:3-methyladenine DNA glycosylase AlkD
MHFSVNSIRAELIKHSDQKNSESAQYFFKEPIDCYGLKAVQMHAIVKEYVKKLKSEPKEVIFSLCEELFKSAMFEETIIASEIAFAWHKKFEPKDFLILERWIELYVNNWATCDTLCNHAVGSFMEKYPEFLPKLLQWTNSENRWLRRAAAVSLIVPARKGKFTDEIFEIALCLLEDKEDLVQKGYGWMLKVCSQKKPMVVFDFVMTHKSKMPRTALRYAIEKLPSELKAEAMKKP